MDLKPTVNDQTYNRLPPGSNATSAESDAASCFPGQSHASSSRQTSLQSTLYGHSSARSSFDRASWSPDTRVSLRPSSNAPAIEEPKRPELSAFNCHSEQFSFDPLTSKTPGEAGWGMQCTHHCTTAPAHLRQPNVGHWHAGDIFTALLGS
jgi:hypothetical protein